MKINNLKVTNEKNLEKRLKEYVKGFGGLGLKWISPGIRGVPDRLLFLPGGVLFIVETKSARGKTRPAQKVIHQKLTDLGFKVYLIKPENLNDLINDIRASQLPKTRDRARN